MRQVAWILLGGGLCPLLSAGAALGQGLQIQHDPVGCLVADRYPRLEARIEPESAGARVRIEFRTEDAADWYYVEMKRDEHGRSGILPKPTKSLKRFRYYIEVTGTDFESARTPEYTAEVVPDASSCGSKLVAAGVPSAGTVVVGGPAGAPAVPPGFAAAGVAGVAAGGAAVGAGAVGAGGVSTGLVVGGVVLGAAAVAGGAVALAGGGDEAPPATSPPVTSPPTTTLPPLPEAHLEFPQDCAVLSGAPIRVGQTVILGFGVGRWETVPEAEAQASGEAASFSVDGVGLPVTYTGVTWHEGGGIPPGWGYAASATWVATAGAHTAIGSWQGPSFNETVTCGITPIG
jgi:hypothetical protein